MEPVKAPRGTHDVLPGESLWVRALEDRMHSCARSFGYEEIRTPMFESTALFRRGVGEGTDIVQKEMYTFLHQGGESLTLRPEGTSPAVRAYIENGLASAPSPVKLYYVAPFFRAETPQKGRYRQFTQFGAEILGAAGPAADSEIISMASFLFKGLGLDGVSLRINSVGCPVCRPAYLARLREFFEGREGDLCEDCVRRLERNPMRVLDCKRPECIRASMDAPVMTGSLCPECLAHFEGLKENLASAGVDFETDPRIVRGLDYYTKTAFEFIAGEIGAQSAVCAGGRYDGLAAELGGPPAPGVGFAVGVERLSILLENRGLRENPASVTHAYFAALSPEAVRLSARIAMGLREMGLTAQGDLMDRSLKAQMRHADRLASRFTVIIGPDEMASGTATVRDMQTKEQTAVAFGDIGAFIKERA